MNKGKLTLTIVVLVVAAAAIMAVKYFTAGDLKNLTSETDFKTKGDPNAPIKIVEFIDFECPACAAGAMFLKGFMETNPDKVYLTLKYYPLPMHKHGLVAASYVQCAGEQEKFWEFHDFVLKEQLKWSKVGDARPVFDYMAESLALDKTKMAQCVEDPKTLDRIMKIKQEGQTLKIKSTPTYYVNGEMVVGMYSLQDKLKVLTDDQKQDQN